MCNNTLYNFSLSIFLTLNSSYKQDRLSSKFSFSENNFFPIHLVQTLVSLAPSLFSHRHSLSHFLGFSFSVCRVRLFSDNPEDDVWLSFAELGSLLVNQINY